jgi:hypothetical protein
VAIYISPPPTPSSLPTIWSPYRSLEINSRGIKAALIIGRLVSIRTKTRDATGLLSHEWPSKCLLGLPGRFGTKRATLDYVSGLRVELARPSLNAYQLVNFNQV